MDEIDSYIVPPGRLAPYAPETVPHTLHIIYSPCRFYTIGRQLTCPVPEPDPPVWKIYEAISKADGKVMSKDKLFVGPKKLTNEKTTDRQTERQGYRKTDKQSEI